MKKFLSTPLGRAFRAIAAAMIATGFTALLATVTTLPVQPVWIPVITGAIMGIEKFFRDRGWLTETTTTTS